MKTRCGKALCAALIAFSTSGPIAATDHESKSEAAQAIVEELVVRATASVALDQLAELTSNIVTDEAINATLAMHPNEIMQQIPGVWISRGSGQEHLTAIRSGVLTGAGACGAYLLLENGIPVRPSGFCNVNGLFELNSEQAHSIEVVRGPASSRYGGNALHGVINVVTLHDDKAAEIAVQGGSNDWRQLRLHAPFENASLTALSAHSGGWRNETGYTNHKLNVQSHHTLGEWDAIHTFAYTSLAQETGGYVVGLDAYKDPALRFSNPNPEAYRDAMSVRYASHLRRGDLLVTPYLRRSQMDFLMHFLPGQPVEDNQQTSGGLLLHLTRELGSRSFAYGVHLDVFDIELSEIQTGPTTGSPFLVATRPTGTHYDFTVTGSTIGAFHDGNLQIQDRWSLTYRVRAELNSYNYDNHHTDGNLRDDGTACGFGGCLYTRPADRSDRFFDVAANIGLERKLRSSTRWYIASGTGFRPPQVAELYRLQSGQEFADVDSEGLTSLETGFKLREAKTDLQFSFYLARNRDTIFRDAEGFNRSGGRIKSMGFEWLLRGAITPSHEIGFSGTLASHKYDYTQNLARREVIHEGNDVDTAPRQLMSLRWDHALSERLGHTVELVYIGKYFLDAANTAEYPGHAIINWRSELALITNVYVQAQLRNVFDRKYADRADLSFGNVRYFPARPRTMQVAVRYEF